MIEIDNKSNKNEPYVQSIHRAINVLRSFNFENPKLRITDISNRLGLHKSTVHRIVKTLENDGLLTHMDNGYYHLSWKVYELGMVVIHNEGVIKLISKILQQIVDKTEETANFAILDGSEVLYIQKVDSSHSLRIYSFMGKRSPSHCTALGKVLLAGLENDKLFRLIYGMPLKQYTPNTITNPDMLRQELMKIKSQGYAVDNEENELGVMSLAVPVTDLDNITYASVSISGPTSRIEKSIENYIDIIHTETIELSKILGSRATFLRQLSYSR